MDEKQIRKIIKDELSNILKLDRYVFDKKVQIMDASNIQFGRTNGTKIGTEGGATGQKFAFWNTTPTTQPSAISDPNDAGATYSQSQVQTIVDKVKLILDKLQALGLIQT